MIKQIAAQVDGKKFPLFVSEGESGQKLARIMGNKYLKACYERLQASKGALFTFGFSFGLSDEHILDAIAKSKIERIYVGLHRADEKDVVEKRIGRFVAKVKFFQSHDVWVEPTQPQPESSSTQIDTNST